MSFTFVPGGFIGNVLTASFIGTNAGGVVDVSGVSDALGDGGPFLSLADRVNLASLDGNGPSSGLGIKVVGEFFGNGGDDTIIGFSRRENFIDGGNGSDFLAGGKLGDIIFGGNGNDHIEGRCGDDLLFGGNGRDTIYGGKGNDTIHGDGGNDWLYGDAGNDKLFGGEGNDRLDGGAGNDMLKGGRGDDLMTGGAGADVFVFSSDNSHESDELDRITDFNRGRDQIDLTGVVGLSAIEVYVTGASRAEMLLLNRAGDVINTIDIQATNAGGRNILLQDSAYGTGENARIKVSGGETLLLPDTFVIL